MIEMYGFWLADIVCLDCLWAATATGKKWNDADILKKRDHYMTSVRNIYVNTVHLTGLIESNSLWGFNSQNVISFSLILLSFHVSIIFSLSNINVSSNLLRNLNLSWNMRTWNFMRMSLYDRIIYTVNYLYHILSFTLNCTLCICGDCIIVQII